MENKSRKLFEEFYEVNQKINENLLNHQLIIESLGQLSLSNLEEFSDLNKRSFSITQELIEELKKNADRVKKNEARSNRFNYMSSAEHFSRIFQKVLTFIYRLLKIRSNRTSN